MKKLVILSGAGISEESGLKTFRDSGGLWEGFDIMEVATPEGWAKNPALVLDFYNQRRKQALTALPNKAHQIIADLDKDFDVTVITQNVDNLHEKAGSKHILHLHGELFKSRSTRNPDLVYEMQGWELNLGDLCPLGSQLRPHIVWFGEMVPMMEVAAEITMDAEIFIVIGTSLQVYPAAGLVDFVPKSSEIYVVDPGNTQISSRKNVKYIREKATVGMEILSGLIISKG